MMENVLHGIEHALPDRPLIVEPLGGRDQSLRLKPQPVRPALDRSEDHSRALEDPQVLRNRRLRDSETSRRCTDCRRAVSESLNNSASNRMRYGAERIVSQ